jgi:AcrR family transcriptional regulator
LSKHVKSQTEQVRPRGRPRSFDRETALEIAMRLFWQQGYDGTSLADLTAAMDIRPASFYAAFGSKESLFMETLERYRSGVGSGLPRIVNSAPTAREAIRMLLDGTAAAITRRAQPRGCMIVLSSLRGFTESTDMERELQRCRAEDQAIITQRLQQATLTGELPPSCAPVSLGAFYMAILQGMSIQARDGVSRAALEDIAACAMQAWPAM